MAMTLYWLETCTHWRLLYTMPEFSWQSSMEGCCFCGLEPESLQSSTTETINADDQAPTKCYLIWESKVVWPANEVSNLLTPNKDSRVDRLSETVYDRTHHVAHIIWQEIMHWMRRATNDLCHGTLRRITEFKNEGVQEVSSMMLLRHCSRQTKQPTFTLYNGHMLEPQCLLQALQYCRRWRSW